MGTLKDAENMIDKSGETIIYKSESTIISKTGHGNFGIYQASIGGYLGIAYIGQNELKAIKKAAFGNATHGVR